MRKLIGCLAGIAVVSGCTTAVTPGTGTATTFKIRLASASAADTLKPSDGSKAPAPISPAAWAVHASGQPIFTDGYADRGKGLEAQAEDGNPANLAASLKSDTTLSSTGVVTIPVGDTAAGPATPGKAFEFTVTAKPGDRLSFTSMFGQSNDVFVAPSADGIALFGADGKPTQGDVTSSVYLWDAGTEANQEPGIGADQAPRQAAPNTGAADPNKTVRKVNDGFKYPAMSEIIKVTITPQ